MRDIENYIALQKNIDIHCAVRDIPPVRSTLDAIDRGGLMRRIFVGTARSTE